MSTSIRKEADKVPEPTLRRLPWYLSNIKLMKEKGEQYVSSTQISKEINIDASQIAKDLSYVNISGSPRVGYNIDALNPELVGKDLNGIPIFHSDDFEAKMKEYDVNIGVLTVPINIAQEITDKMVDGGIKAVWNFTPFRIRVPENIVVQNTSLYAHLAVMFNRLNFNEK